MALAGGQRRLCDFSSDIRVRVVIKRLSGWRRRRCGPPSIAKFVSQSRAVGGGELIGAVSRSRFGEAKTARRCLRASKLFGHRERRWQGWGGFAFNNRGSRAITSGSRCRNGLTFDAWIYLWPLGNGRIESASLPIVEFLW